MSQQKILIERREETGRRDAQQKARLPRVRPLRFAKQLPGEELKQAEQPSLQSLSMPKAQEPSVASQFFGWLNSSAASIWEKLSKSLLPVLPFLRDFEIADLIEREEEQKEKQKIRRSRRRRLFEEVSVVDAPGKGDPKLDPNAERKSVYSPNWGRNGAGSSGPYPGAGLDPYEPISRRSETRSVEQVFAEGELKGTADRLAELRRKGQQVSLDKLQSLKRKDSSRGAKFARSVREERET